MNEQDIEKRAEKMNVNELAAALEAAIENLEKAMGIEGDQK